MRALLLLLALLTPLRADPVLDAWLKRQAALTTLDSAFTQQRTLPSLKEPVTTPGRVSFAKPDKFRWQLGDPMQTLAVSDGSSITLIDESEKTARVIPADSPHVARFTLLSGKAFADKESFDRAFEIVETRVVSAIHQYTLKPVDRRLRSQIPWIFIDIDPAKNQLRALELELKDKSRLRTVFHRPRFDAPLPDTLFKPDLGGYTLAPR